MSDEAWVRDFIAAAESGHAGKTLELVEAVRKERWAVKEAATLGMASLKAGLDRESCAAGRNRVLRQWLAECKNQVVAAWSQLGFPLPPKSTNVECQSPRTDLLCPEAHVPPAGPVPDKSVPAGVIVFDFDQTLCVRHVGVFEELSRITDRAFGGPERVEMLRDLLSQLSKSHAITLVSRNSRHIIGKVLQQLDLGRFFVSNMIFGFEDFGAHRSRPPKSPISGGAGDEVPKSAIILERILSPLGLSTSNAVFVDDDPGNVSEVRRKCPGISIVKSSRFGLGSQECKQILFAARISQ